MSDYPRGRGRGRGRGDRGDRGGGGRGGRGRGDTELPFRSGGRGGGDRGGGDRGGRGEFRGDFRGRGRGDFGRGDFGGRGGRGGFRGSGNQGPRIFNEGQPIPAPDAQVEKVENANAQALTLGRKKTADSARYPDRPGYGTLGRPVTLYANYMPFAAVGKPVFRYHVHIAKDQGKDLPVKKARQVVRLLLEEHFASDIKNIATDYRSTLISCVELRLGGEDKKFDVRWKSENEVEYMDEPKVYNVTVGATGTLDPVDLVNYLTSSSVTTPLMHQEQIIGAMNIIIGHQPKTDRSVVTLSGNKHFSLNPAISERMSLGGGLEALRGYFVSVRAATARVLLNVQVKYLACYQEGPLPMVIGEFLRTNSRNTYRLESFLKRMRICASHIVRKTSSGKSRPPAVKSIAGLATPADGRSSANPPRVARHGAGPFDVEFFLEAPGSKPPAAQAAQPGGKGKKGKKPVKAGPAPAGQYISVGAYFKREYKKDLDPDMPVINVGNRQFPMYLPVDICMVQPGQPVGTKLSPNQTSDMLKFAVMGRKPAQNAQSIVSKGAGMLGLEPLNATLAAFGVRVDNNLITVQGRVLSPPKIMYAKQKEIMTMAGSWNMKAIQFSRPVPLKNWTYLYVTTERARTYWQNPATMMESLRKFTSVLRSMGIEAEMPKEGQRVVLNGSNGSDAEVIERAVRQLQDRYKPSMILGVLYGKDTTLYNTIKQVCDVRCGVRNVNVQAEKLAVAQDQYCANVGLKINLKLGGGNQSLRSSDLGLFGNGKTMLVGLDVTHPSPGSSSNAPSVAAIVASVDPTLAQWPAEIRIQGSRNEMVADLDVLMQSRLKLWAKHNKNKYPGNIVVYRDGVSEGQYNLVLDNELPLLKRACAAVYPAAETKRGLPAMSIIIVGKRHNTRFYPTSDADADRSANPMPGTVVDRGVSESKSWDFFLQAHSALQGTARPAHYFTIWDEIFYPQHPGTNGARGAADVLQDLTHKMCYLFGRATKAVSVCPPAYYADLVCTRARCYLSDLFDPSLSNPEASVVGTEGAGQMGGDENVLIHPNVKDTMFYI